MGRGAVGDCEVEVKVSDIIIRWLEGAGEEGGGGGGGTSEVKVKVSE